MKICVVGGSGFIGTRFCRRLVSANKSFKILDKEPSIAFLDEFALADVRSIDSLRSQITEGSILVNLAAEHRDDVRPVSLYYEVNVEGAHNLCIVAREKKVTTIVFTSTVAVYGLAPRRTDESGKIAPFNDYGRTKFEAEEVFRAWQAESPTERTLVILRPTVVFGEQNRGNVFNLLQQIATGRFVMVGRGENRKSMAYVENVAACIEYCLEFAPGLHVYNYVDKPDFNMNDLLFFVNRTLGRCGRIYIRLPSALGYLIGNIFDVVAAITGKKFAVSAVRVKKFLSDSIYDSSIRNTGFEPPVSLMSSLEKTIRYEFLEDSPSEKVFHAK